MPVTESDRGRKQRILEGLRGRSLERAAADPGLRPLLEEEAASAADPKLVTRDLLAVADATRAARDAEPSLSLFFSTDDVIIVPGFMGSELVDATGGRGVVWIDPLLARRKDELLALKLAAGHDTDDGPQPAATIRPNGAIPLLYSGLKADLEVRRYDVQVYGFDWRKHIDASAGPLAELIRDRATRPPRPLHLIAHSQGSLVARRAVQLLGPELARRLVNNLVLLGPATAGTFSAAFAVAGTHELIETVRQYGVEPPAGFTPVLQSMSGLYQLLPWRTDPVAGTPTDAALDWVRGHNEFKTEAFWKPCDGLDGGGVDRNRLSGLYGWGKGVDASFLNDRTTIILGDTGPRGTVGGVKFDGNRLVKDEALMTAGDGTVPDSLARVDGVTRVYKAAGAEHMMLPATWAVIVAVRNLLAGRSPEIQPFAAAGADGAATPFLAAPPLPSARPRTIAVPAGAAVPPATPAPGPARIADITPPTTRRLRVFSFDPLFGTELDGLGADQVTVELPWEFADGDRLRPGPVGEYLEVVDFDATSRCFYPPVDLNHPHVLARDGIPVSEGDPRFHQQMVYAVAMNTIRHFEAALGRSALWAPRLERDEFGELRNKALRPEEEYVGRLRVYPHAMRERNAYYSPAKKALLFGYFAAQTEGVGRNLPGGMVFACLSYDIVAHETTHALLDGLHRYFTQPSNPDVFAFHEAFADMVALLQHFSHPQVLTHQIAKTRGDLGAESSLGVLAAQFGEATGRGGALRQYLGEKRRVKDGRTGVEREVWVPKTPDPAAILTQAEPHARGAILVAALFRAFSNIYEGRVRDLRRIATGGTGVLPEGDLHPDLVGRLADEAAKAARHLLRMCVRALDYVPPVDVTFGEYLRALVTADYDLVRDDDRQYRVAVVSAFRDWGIYPAGVRSLSVDSLLWSPPEWVASADDATRPAAGQALARLQQFFDEHPVGEWAVGGDRRAAYLRMCEHNRALHDWLSDRDNFPDHLGWVLGLALDPATAPGGIRRRPVLGKDRKPVLDADGIPQVRPVFQVHMLRPARRIGPDGQVLTDVVVDILQRRKAFFDEDRQTEVDANRPELTDKPWDENVYDSARPDFYFRGGCTLVIDPRTGAVRYCVRKAVHTDADSRLTAERKFRRSGTLSAGASYLTPPDGDNPFAALHDHGIGDDHG